jgi:hypothetical protein
MALRDLAGYGRQLAGTDAPALAVDAVASWAHQQADGVVRRAVLGWLMQPARTPAEQAATALERCLAMLQARAMQAELDLVQAELQRSDLRPDRRAALSQQLLRVRREQLALGRSSARSA